MEKVIDILSKIEEIIPKSLSDSYVEKFNAYDNHGLIVGNEELQVKKIMLCLDLTEDILEESIKRHVDLVICHHPLVFYPINNISTQNTLSKKIVKLIQNKIALIALHLSLDMVDNGVNSALGNKYNGKVLEHLQKVDDKNGLGEIRQLDSEISFKELVKQSKEQFKYEQVRWYGKERPVNKIAYIGGAGSLEEKDIHNLKQNNVDVYITGEIKHHEIINFLDNNINLILLGHYNSEVVVMDNLKQMLEKILDKDIEIVVSKKLALN